MWTVEAQLKKFQRGTIFATEVEKIPVILLAKKEKEGGGPAFFPCSKNLPDLKF